MRKNIAAANWKMNLDLTQGIALAQGIADKCAQEYKGDAEVIFAPAYPMLHAVAEVLKGHDRFFLAAQNIHQEEKGAYTAEVSADMLTSVGVTHVIIGHSERRQYFGETEPLLARKINQTLKHNLKVIYCIGERLEQREAGQEKEVIQAQIEGGIFHLTAKEMASVCLAYEPVWAIGTGKTASPEQAQEMHAFIRSLLNKKFGSQTSENTSILYGGSVKPSNADELFGQTDIDGGLVGGASLRVDDFCGIIKAL